MNVLSVLKEQIGKVGIKETARRAHLSPSTVSRIFSGQISPGFEVVVRISEVLGLEIKLQARLQKTEVPRLDYVVFSLRNLKKALNSLGVKHAIIFGSVARKQDGPNSDIDICLDFGSEKPKAQKLLRAEGLIFEIFSESRVDIINQSNLKKNSKLKHQIETDGIRVF